MEATRFTTAGRFEPRELGSLDLELPDPRVVWASSATASSSWGSSYTASAACGPPCVYPNAGDEVGTWLAASSDRDPWIELTFPELVDVRGIVICETCGPGAVCEVRDADRDAVLYAREPERIADTRSARLLHVPLSAGSPAPRRLRLRLAPWGSDYHEVDAVALLTAPLEAILDTPCSVSRPHRRYTPAEVAKIDLRGDWRILWAKRARASSEWSPRYAARHAVGPPKVFPRGGDIEGAWLSANDDRGAWLELEFGEHARVHGLIVLETCGAGSVVRATDERGETLFQAKRDVVASREARLLHVPLEPSAAPAKIRLWVSSAESDYREIDAVALLAAPFEELFEPPPPPPSPPVPGAPEAGFTILEGVLVGPSRESPFVHAILRTSEGGRAANAGGPVRLRLDSGEEVTLETGRAAIYGGRFARRIGTWAEVSAELPSLAAAFDTAPPRGEVVLEGRRLDGDQRVHVAGTPSGARAHGFRDSARSAPESLVAIAISSGPLDRTSFGTEGVGAFERGARAHEPRPATPHPLGRWARSMAIATAACLLTVVAEVAIAGEATVVSALAMLAGLYAAVLSIELGGRLAFVPTFLRSTAASLHDRRPAFTSFGWTLFGAGSLLVLASAPLLAVSIAGWPEALLVRGAFVLTAPLALLRFALYARNHAPAILPALRVVLARRARPALGARGRFTGTIAEGQRFTRSESLETHSEYLGTESYTDSSGRVVTQPRYRSWVERKADAQGPGRVRLLVDDVDVVSARPPRTTHLAPRFEPAREHSYARFATEHIEGEEATLVGSVTSADGEALEIDATHLVLGRLTELRVRVAAQIVVLAALASLVAAGGLALAL